MPRIFLCLPVIVFLFLQACQPPEPSAPRIVPVDTLSQESLQKIITTESALLAIPTEMTFVEEGQFAVYDIQENIVKIFSTDGAYLSEFGGSGDGPGEWDPTFGAGDLNYLEGQFLLSNRGKYLFDHFDAAGSYLDSDDYPQYLQYTHKTLLPGRRLLVSTHGNENALAAVLDLENGGEILHTAGAPESDVLRPDMADRRSAFANGEIPLYDRNITLSAYGDDGYYLMMNALGELRRYTPEGALADRQILPETVTEPIFDHVVQQNEELRPGSLFMLQYAVHMQKAGDRIYLLSNTGTNDQPEFRLLAYDLELNLREHLLIPVEEGGFYSQFHVRPNNQIYLVDAYNAQIIRIDRDGG